MNSKRKKPVPKYDSFASLLQGAGLRPTRQRLALAGLLFDRCHKHVTAEQVHAAIRRMRVSISLATIYNTLNAFTGVGLLRQIAIDGGQVYFDTNTNDHHHLFDEENRRLSDIPTSFMRLAGMPRIPAGKVLSRVDIVLRVRHAK
jgi:Fur family transcriptional regulator, iron response regulator